MYLDAKIQSSFSYIWCRVRPAHQRSAPGLGLSGCPHKWNTYGNLPQWSAGLGNRRSQNINTLFSIKLDLDIFYKYSNQTWYLCISWHLFDHPDLRDLCRFFRAGSSGPHLRAPRGTLGHLGAPWGTCDRRVGPARPSAQQQSTNSPQPTARLRRPVRAASCKIYLSLIYFRAGNTFFCIHSVQRNWYWTNYH